MSKNIGNTIGKTWSGKYSQNLIDHAKQSATDAFKTSSKRAIQKTAGKLVIWLVIADTFTKVSKTATYEEEIIGVDRKIPRERCISQKKDRKFLIM